MEIAGHSALEMTMNVYGHVTLDDKRDALDRLGALFEEAEMTPVGVSTLVSARSWSRGVCGPRHGAPDAQKPRSRAI